MLVAVGFMLLAVGFYFVGEVSAGEGTISLPGHVGVCTEQPPPCGTNVSAS